MLHNVTFSTAPCTEMHLFHLSRSLHVRRWTSHEQLNDHSSDCVKTPSFIYCCYLVLARTLERESFSHCQSRWSNRQCGELYKSWAKMTHLRSETSQFRWLVARFQRFSCFTYSFPLPLLLPYPTDKFSFEQVLLNATVHNNEFILYAPYATHSLKIHIIYSTFYGRLV